MAYIGKLIRAGRPFTKRQVMERFEVGDKAVQRDIDFMRDRLWYEILWDKSNRHYSGRAPRRLTL
jgi:hypothetical protein